MTANAAMHSNTQHGQPLHASMYKVFSRLLTLHRRLKKQEKYLENQLPVLLAEVVPGYRHNFSCKDIKRLAKYYQLALNLICDNFYQLTGNTLHDSEHRRILLLSIFMPLFDDLFDDQLLDDAKITILVEHPEHYTPANAADLVVKALYLELLRVTPHRDLFIQHLQEGTRWEKASLKQLSDRITEEELYEITYNKSYYSLLLFFDVLDHYPSPEIQSMFYPVAGLMQLTNDAFDVWKDVHNGIYTLPILYRDFNKLQHHFLAEIAAINHRLSQLPYPAKAKQTYAITIHALHAMGWMSLEQLKKVTAGISTTAALKTLSRKELICDIDGFAQQIKWAQHVKQLCNYYGASSSKIRS